MRGHDTYFPNRREIGIMSPYSAGCLILMSPYSGGWPDWGREQGEGGAKNEGEESPLLPRMAHSPASSVSNRFLRESSRRSTSLFFSSIYVFVWEG